MKQLKFQVIAFIICCIVIAFTPVIKTGNILEQNFKEEEPGGFALLELFTSQGCSSCPPADKLLASYAKKNDKNIIALSFHVDYWNRLGWKDPFSNAAFSRRQRDYAMLTSKGSVYTPQLIINGEREMIGSDEDKVAKAVLNVLKHEPPVKILINKLHIEGNQISINYSLNPINKNTTLQAALVQNEVVTNILRGENRGVKLTNYNIVREFKSTPINTSSSSVIFDLSPDINKEDLSIVLFVQDDASGKITGAVKQNIIQIK